MKTSQNTNSKNVGFILIGRNEGERFKIGLNAVRKLYPHSPVVYVDSGSTDDSVAFASSMGVSITELDMSEPFTAARARNAGARALLKDHPDLFWLQFLDGDCEVLEGWVEKGLEMLSEDSTIGIVSGRRAERFPQNSLYNRLIDMEWNTPIGEIMGVPGDMLMSVEMYNKADGFNDALIAGEDFDLCLRCKNLGFRTYRIDAPMSMHDADIMHFSQWAKRTKRGGHAYANLHHIHKGENAANFTRKIFSIFVWGACIPLMLIASLILWPTGILVILIFILLMVAKNTIKRMNEGDEFDFAWRYSALGYIAKAPELMGVVEYWQVLKSNRKHTLIEYK